MSFRLMLLGLAVLVVFLSAACAPPPNLRDDTLLNDDSLITTDEACSAPCWRGITPGETAWRDALTIVEDAGDFENIQTQTDEETGTIAAIWQPTGGTQCCQMAAEDGATVNLIFLRTRPNHTVGEVIERHGEPTYALGTPFSEDQAIINLVFPDLPMIVFAFVAGSASGEVSEQSEVIGVLYTTADAMELFLQSNPLHTWEGYAPYSTYSSEEGSLFEVTPSVTMTPTGTGE